MIGRNILQGARNGSRAEEPVDFQEALRLVQECLAKRDVDAGRRVQTLILSNGLDQVSILGNHLIRLFAICGSLHDASALFLKVEHPSLHTWHAIISAHSSLGEPVKALHLYQAMQLSGRLPDKVIFLSTLKTCSILPDAWYGMMIHDHILRNSCEIDIAVCSSLIDMYSKCGFLKEAWILFEKSESRDVVMWGAIITGCSQHEYDYLVIDLFEKMMQEGIEGDRVIYVCVLKACNNAIHGNLLYDELIRKGCGGDVIVITGLVGLYVKLGLLDEADNIFNKVSRRDVVLWSALIGGFADRGDGYVALDCFEKMIQNGETPDAILFLSVLNACGYVGEVVLGRFVHDQIIKSGWNSEIEIANTTIDMYVKCGTLEEGRRMFEYLHNRTVVSWDIMIAGYAQYGQNHGCLELFERMQAGGLMPANSTCCLILKMCCNQGLVSIGRMIHSLSVKCGNDTDAVFEKALVEMYGKSGCLSEAQYVFDGLFDRDVVSWSVLITGYVEAGLASRALNAFIKMQECGLNADEYIYSCVLKASGIIQSVDTGRLIHEQTIRLGYDTDIVVQGALIDMYLKCGSFEDGDKVFDQGFNCDVVSWNTLLDGCIEHEQGHRALDWYIQMRHRKIVPNDATFLCVCKACGATGAIDLGRISHAEIIENNLDANGVMCNTLIDMYGKCGRLCESRKLFDGLSDRNVISWNALIAGYSQYGLVEQALKCLNNMQSEGEKPNTVTYVSVLAACTHACEIEEALQHFSSMRGDFGVTPTIEHFGCLLDLLGRSGCLEEAEELLQTMPLLPDKCGLTSLLSSCKVYDNVELGKRCFEQVAAANDMGIYSYVSVASKHLQRAVG